MPKQFGKTAKMAGGGEALVGSWPLQAGEDLRWAISNPMEYLKLLQQAQTAKGGAMSKAIPSNEQIRKAAQAQQAQVMRDATRVPTGGLNGVDENAQAQKFMADALAALRNRVAPSPAAGGPMAGQQATAGTVATQAAAMQPRPMQGPAMPPQQANVHGVPGMPMPNAQPPMGPPRPPVDPMAAMAAMAQQSAPPPAPLNLPPPRMPQSPQGALPTPAPAAASPVITGSGEDAPLPPPGSGATPPFLPPRGKNKVDWRDFLQKALMSGIGGMTVGASGINPIAGAGLGALVPLITELIKKKKKTGSDTEKKAKGGVVQAKKSTKKFGGAKKSAPKRSVEPDGDEMMAPGLPPGMAAMKKGGCVKTKKMATGGLVSRGMGAARGGSFKSY